MNVSKLYKTLTVMIKSIKRVNF